MSTFEQYARNLQRCQLTQCSVAKSREGPFNIVDKCLQLDKVCSHFGSFVKLLCDTQEFEPATSTAQIAMRNVFDVLMRRQAALSQRDKLPQRIDSCNKKDELFNDLVDLFEEKGWTWVDGGNTLGKSFLSKLWDVLWYIDGHHAAFENCSLPIPEALRQFSGYNTPELSKHRKRKVGNMSYDILISHVGYLKECLLTGWMQQQRWCALRGINDELATCWDDYTTYLHQQSKIVKQKQDSHSVSDFGTVKVLPINASVSSRIQPLYSVLEEKPVYTQVAVNAFAPMDPKLKYQYMRDLEKGLPIPSVLYTCSFSLNYHYLWKILEGVSIESATNENLRIIN